MMKRSYTKYFAAIFILASLFSCKKDNNETLPTLGGSIYLSLPAFVTAGETFEIELGGEHLKSTVYRNEAGGIGYYFYDSKLAKRDTVRKESQPLTDPVKYTLVCQEEIGSFTLTCGAYASGYYSVTDIATLNLVDPAPGRSLTGFEEHEDDLHFTDSRDDRSYLAVKIGSLYWMRQNLAWEGAGRSYLSSLKDYRTPGASAISTIFGRYYSWEEAKGACPEGWRLPSAAELAEMVSAVNAIPVADALSDIDGVAGSLMGKDLEFNGNKLWLYWRDVEITDKSTLSLMPTGYAINTVEGLYSFHGYGSYSALWTSSEKDGRGVYRYIFEKYPILYCGLGDKESLSIPVRCVKSAE